MRNRLFLITVLVSFFISIHGSDAALKTFIKEYIYQASELDSKVTCRTNAMEQVKRLLLEELGTYLESHTVAVDFQITKDQITSLTAGIVETKILDESWNGVQYWLKAEMKADADEVVDSVEKLRRDWDQSDEIEETRKQLESALAENEKLKTELHSKAKTAPSTASTRQYNQNINKIRALNLYTKAHAVYRKGNLKQAFKLAKASLDLDPQSPKAYGLLLRIYQFQGQKELAQRTVKEILTKELNPADSDTYVLRGFAYQTQKKDRQAIKELSLGIKLNPSSDKLYRARSFSFSRMRQGQKALADANKAIELKADDYRNIMIRGVAYARGRRLKPAIADFDKAIQMNPKAAKAYFFRGMAHKRKRNSTQAKQDFNKACQLGFRKACKESI